MKKRLTLGSFIVNNRLKEEGPAEGGGVRCTYSLMLNPLKRKQGVTGIAHLKLSVPGEVYEACPTGKIFELTEAE